LRIYHQLTISESEKFSHYYCYSIFKQFIFANSQILLILEQKSIIFLISKSISHWMKYISLIYLNFFFNQKFKVFPSNIKYLQEISFIASKEYLRIQFQHQLNENEVKAHLIKIVIYFVENIISEYLVR
jgi:hypothetical protein